MRLLSLSALLALQTTTTFAFYPYYRDDADSTSQDSPRAVSKPRSTSGDPVELRVPIYKIPNKRANTFNIVLAADPGQEHSLGVHQDGDDHSYLCSFKVGTSQKDFHLLLDSAASNTWLMNAGCTTDACNKHTTLSISDSSTLKTQPGTFSVTYGTGSVEGGEGSDTVHFADISVPLTFGLATTVSNEFSSFPMDGILGLGRQENIVDKTGMIDAPVLMDVLITEKVITSKLYALDLCRASDGGQNTGALHFGKLDDDRYEGSINYVAAIKNNLGFWEVPVGDAGVNGNIAGTPGRTAIIDSGTSYILMPRDDAVQLHELITGYKFDGVEGFTVPCGSTAKVQLTFGGKTYDIQPADYIGSKLASGDCSTNIIGRQTFGARQWLVGDVFLKNVYTVFDFDGQRVGFGVKKAVSTPKPPSSSGELPLAISTDSLSGVSIFSATATFITTFIHSAPELGIYIDITPTDSPHSIVHPIYQEPDELVAPTKHVSQPIETAQAPEPSTRQAPLSTPESPPPDASTTADAPSQNITETSSAKEPASTMSSTLLTTSASVSGRPSGTGTSPTLLPPGATTSSNVSAGLSGTIETESGASASATADANAAIRYSFSNLLAYLTGLLAVMIVFG